MAFGPSQGSPDLTASGYGCSFAEQIKSQPARILTGGINMKRIVVAGLVIGLSSAIVYASRFDAERPSAEGALASVPEEASELLEPQNAQKTEIEQQADQAARDGDCALIVDYISERFDGTEKIHGLDIPRRVFSVEVKDSACEIVPTELIGYGSHQDLPAGTSIVFAKTINKERARIRFSSGVSRETTIASMNLNVF
jgi:hypothetical protein